MQVKERDSYKRNNERIDLSFMISLPGQDGKTKNISASGVYFEVITNDIEAFAPGTMMPIQIIATTTTPGFEERNIKLKGEGRIVRNNIKDVTTQGNRLGVALEFKNRLDILPELT
ncbi:MAG: PilZ domain-containing protein [Candidatus Scalindua sp.]